MDISSAGQTADTPPTRPSRFEQDDLTESQSSAGTIEGDLTERWARSIDKETGTAYYIVENQKTGDAE